MAAIEFLDQESAANPDERGNRPDGCNQAIRIHSTLLYGVTNPVSAVMPNI